MRARTIPNIKSPTGQHGFDYDIIKEFHRENLNIINDQIDLLTSESEKLADENDKLADEITSLNQEITQLSSLLNSLSYDDEDPFNNNQQRSAIEARLQLASQQITLKKNQITKNNTRISEIKRLITEANTAVAKADKLITNIIRDIKNADSSYAERLRRLIENIQAYNQNIKNLSNKLSEYGAKYDGDTKVGKVTIDGKEYDIKDKIKGFDIDTTKQIYLNQIINMSDTERSKLFKEYGITDEVMQLGISRVGEDFIGIAILFIIVCMIAGGPILGLLGLAAAVVVGAIIAIANTEKNPLRKLNISLQKKK